MDISKASDGLRDPQLLETIDKLAELHIGDSVALPQLLVVGDQSSGKSSVLEGLTGLPFPRDSTLCTRFATQITFRRAPNADISVSIIPSKDASKEDSARMRAWNKNGITSLDRTKFSGILEELRRPERNLGHADSGSTAVPGIFRKITEGVTTQIDIANVRAMAERYMGNLRSVILAVVPANIDIATYEILEMASKYNVE
ncbi:MAG: hypothetical protein L6R38_000778 [Xanthoria sp. 2 TBL-2021]|nr:MAG: hypothetical protein L6R38_000778 [Xanthoria sp. 2 TBL-2021]